MFLVDRLLSHGEALARVKGKKYGAVVTFYGYVRDTEDGSPIESITYESYDAMAEKEIGKIIREARKRWNVSVSLQHRIGKISAGEPSVFISCAGVHRIEAFKACQFIIDEIKSKVPIWKVKFE